MYLPIINPINFNGTAIDVLRLDLIHPLYGGNKFFKLKYNIREAKNQSQKQILSFGGVHSNHIFSLAALCKEEKIKSIGIIRGEEKNTETSPTLQFAKECGMELHFVNSETYRKKAEREFVEKLENNYGNFYLIPEGGANKEGVKGCTEILTSEMKSYEFIFCACGTAGTFSGIKVSAGNDQKVIGISVLKGENELVNDANKWFEQFNSPRISLDPKMNLDGSTILNNYDFGGYAKYSKQLADFKMDFEKQYKMPLDHIYTSKLFYAVFDLLKQSRISKDSKILIVHSGGLQGNKAFEERYQLNPIL